MDPRERAGRLATERARARAERDFGRADALREEIARLGFEVADTAEGFTLAERARYERFDPQAIPGTLDGAPGVDASIHLLYEEHRSDLYRFIRGMSASSGTFEVVVADNASNDGDWIEDLAVGRVRAVHFSRPAGWAEARNAAAQTSAGAILVFADLSVEPKGDLVGPLVAALRDPSVGICGPWGLVSEDLRAFTESAGPDVDAIEGYLLAVRREVFAQTGFDAWFKWYRHADLDLSFRIRALGLRALVVDVPAERHEHHGWLALGEPERSARSKKNFYRFLDHWKTRSDLLVRGS
jgi:cysteinyl-tRNA synthetase